MNDMININGLQDGISVIENDNDKQLICHADYLYTTDVSLENFPSSAEFWEDESWLPDYYDPVDFGEAITLLAVVADEQNALGTAIRV